MAAPKSSKFEALILENGDLVKRIARHLLRRMPGNVELDDLVQAGMVGLLEAAERYTGGESASFATFATFATLRIRGAMLDSLRAADWSPRSLRRRLRDIEAARRGVEVDTCAAAQPRVIAAVLGLDLETYHRALRDSNLALVMSLEEKASAEGAEFIEPIDANPLPDEALDREQALHAVMTGLSALPEFDHAILWLYYEEEYLLREIAALLAVTESRVSQIHKRIIDGLRATLRSDPNGRLKPGASSHRPYRSRALPVHAASG